VLLGEWIEQYYRKGGQKMRPSIAGKNQYLMSDSKRQWFEQQGSFLVNLNDDVDNG
jgi:hypothetical protein